MTINAEFRRALQTVDGRHPVPLLQITHPSFSAPFHLAGDTQNFTSQGQVYVGYPFGFDLPSDRTGENPRLQLVIDGVGGEVLQELESLTPGLHVMAKLILVDRRTPDVHGWSVYMPMVTARAAGATITATVGVDILMRRAACLLKHDPYTTPGVF